MRTFIIMLIIANLAYLGWHQANPPKSWPVMDRSPLQQASQTLQLLSEIPEAEPTVQQTQADQPLSCISLGVFDTTDEGDFLVSAMLERGMKAQVELLPALGNTRFRIYMPPFNSNTAARQTLEALQDAGFDSFIITSGDFSGGISLGLFSEKDRALALQESLAGTGFPTLINEISTFDTEIWVTIQGLSQDLLEGSKLLDLLSDGLDLQVQEKPC